MTSAPANAPPENPPPRGEDATPAVVIDRRPLPLVLLSRLRSQLLFILLLAGFFGLLTLEAPQGLSEAGWRVLCLFALAVSLWVTTLIPLAITSLLTIAMIPLLDIASTQQTYAYFGSKAVFFILGAFILGAAVVGCGLSTRLTMLALTRFGRTPRRLVLTIYLLVAVGSCVMSEHAVAAMAFPIVFAVSRALNLTPGRSPMGKALFFALAWGCIIGGTTTILGGGRGPLAIGILEESTRGQASISFAEYIVLDLPLVIILLTVGLVVLSRMKLEIDTVAPALERVKEQIRELGKTTLQERLVAAIMVVTVAAWTIGGEEIGLANIAILSTAALFALQLVTWRDVEENVNWGVLLMYGGAITLGSTMADTGAAEWFTAKLLGDWGASSELLLMTLGALTVVMTEFMSNSAVIAIVMPAALSLAGPAGIDPRMMTMAVVLPSNFAFMLPMATPATAMAYSAGYFRPAEAVRRGAVLDLTGLVALALLVYGYWPLLQALGWLT